MILRPVTPQSADGPPRTKLPVGFTMYSAFGLYQSPRARGASTVST